MRRSRNHCPSSTSTQFVKKPSAPTWANAGMVAETALLLPPSWFWVTHAHVAADFVQLRQVGILLFLILWCLTTLPKAVASWGVDYIVLTSVDRDDLADGGSGHFAETVRAMEKLKPEIMVECLTSDFRGDLNAVSILVHSG